GGLLLSSADCDDIEWQSQATTITMFHDRTCSLLSVRRRPWPDLGDRAAREWHSLFETVPASESGLLASHLPASLREWYSFPDAIAVASRQNRLRPVKAFELLGDEQLVVFMDENQGVCHWAIPLNSGDDPRVLVSVDGDPFLPCADTFSDHIF